jgi:hypothetical protein
MKAEICKRFQEYIWHDSKIRSFALVRREENEKAIEDMHFDLDLHVDPTIEANDFKKAVLIFKNCLFIEFRLNLLGKRWCSDDIHSAECLAGSSYVDVPIEEIGTSLGHDLLKDFENHIHFAIRMVPPGGDIDIIAEDFEVQITSPPYPDIPAEGRRVKMDSRLRGNDERGVSPPHHQPESVTMSSWERLLISLNHARYT